MQKVFHILFASWIFISSTGLLVNRHFCQNDLKSTTLLVQAPSCHEEMATEATCPLHAQHQVSDQESNHCCQNESVLFKTVLLQEAQFSAGWGLSLLPAVLPTPVGARCFSGNVGSPRFSFTSYHPPPLVCDVAVQLQTFRC